MDAARYASTPWLESRRVRQGLRARRHAGVLWLVPFFMALHNFEEALLFPRYLPLVAGRIPEEWRALAGALTLGQVWAALALVTLIPILLATWASLRPGAAVPVWLLLLIQTSLLVNVVWHATAAVLLFSGYAPGLVTALAINLPFSVYLLRRAARESWVSRPARWALLPAALLLHGPGLTGILLLAERL